MDVCYCLGEFGSNAEGRKLGGPPPETARLLIFLKMPGLHHLDTERVLEATKLRQAGSTHTADRGGDIQDDAGL